MADRNLHLALRISANAKGAPEAVRGLKGEIDGLSSSVRDFARQAAVAFGGAFTARAFLDANASIQSLNLSFKQITESEESAGREMAFVRAEADRLGLVVQGAADSYLGLTAAAKGTNLEGQATRDIYSAVAESMARLGKSDADTQGALVAISQIMSKGTVAAEELRGQLGERLPGAFQIAARAMGVSTAELGKMLEQGKIVADDFLPRFAAELNKTFGGGGNIETYNANLARLKNSITEAFVKIGSGGTFDAISRSISTVADNFDTISKAALATGGVIASVYAGKAATAIATTTSAMASNVAQFIAARQAAAALAVQEKAGAAAALAQARSHEVAATAALAEANAHRANVAQLAIYGPVRAAAERQATAAAAQHVLASQAVVAADARLVAATAAVTAAQSTMALASRGLASVVGVLGGPIGIVTTLLSLGAFAWLAWGDKAESAAEKARRATKTVGEQADAIIQRLKKEDKFGTGDLSVLREQAANLERQINILYQSSGSSPGAAALLEEKWTALNEVTAAIEKLSAKEKEQADEFKRLAGGQAVDAKEMAKEHKKAIEESIKGYETLVEKNREAWETSLKAERDYLDEAKRLRAQAHSAADTSTPQGQAEANRDLLIERQKLERLASTAGTSYEDIKAQADAVRDLANATQDGARAKDILREADLAQARGAEAAAAAQKTQSEGLREEWKNSEQIVKDLQTALDSIGEKRAINIESDQAKIILAEITAQLDAIKDKTITVTVVPLGPNGQVLENIPLEVPAKASGGPIFGPGGPRDDRVLAMLSNGEHVFTAAEVAAAGGHAAVYRLRKSLLAGLLPRFAAGGMVGAASRLSEASSAPAFPHLGRRVRVDLNMLGRDYEMQGDAAVVNNMIAALEMDALKRGSRRLK